MHAAQGKELPMPVAPYWKGAIASDLFYLATIEEGKPTYIHAGPYPTEERALGDVWAVTDTSGT
jgi:hypothetical protein